MENLIVQRKGRGDLAPKDPKEGWVDCTLDFILQQCEVTRDVIQMTKDKDHPIEMFEEEAVIEQLKEGRIIYTPMLLFRAIVGENTCPLCGATYQGMGSLSRKDNETEICSDCGTREAMEDFLPAKK
ncbi:hypothetical protein CVD28_03740 [Bacillus sp. M6-12]|uniref:hypothetical protein n=1 Tax=Bacillus sp. M6-12 TaxID=2054166 RepID=UPI000C761C13|nr:hypothetical protein [Bacillus sp. M6-12]PLS19540.1 hypothetical protein CVD28_03740 [Bacillus sp. M6-12]